MEWLYQLKYRLTKAALAVFGPADRSGDADPTAVLEREHREHEMAKRSAAREHKPTPPPPEYMGGDPAGPGPSDKPGDHMQGGSR